ncbi:RNA-binding protein nob1, putative isoform 2 [Hibiscus syriacus]|uniref:RNA-binding protein nob1, putative isoform 2 n=1 Tax=Hibiscus syriacus TaxID=106335 RepID=A0A6A3A4G8_HIBSY|nr:RNA-binding protein nob1, putative isoform 2 [Hibiscus syriacus]
MEDSVAPNTNPAPSWSNPTQLFVESCKSTKGIAVAEVDANAIIEGGEKLKNTEASRKDVPGWGSNVPNPKEWEALERETGDGSNSNSRILPMKDLNMNIVSSDNHSEDGLVETKGESHSENKEDADQGFRRPSRYLPQKKEVKIEGKKMVADGIDASQGQFDNEGDDWLPAKNNVEDASGPHQLLQQSAEDACRGNGVSKEAEKTEIEKGGEDLSSILKQMRLEEGSARTLQEENEAETAMEEAVSDDNMGLRLLAPGGMQIRQLHRIFCPKCGNGGTLRKVAVTVVENGIVLASHRPRITLRGTKYSMHSDKIHAVCSFHCLYQGGSAITKNLILREDQLPQKLIYPKTKKKGDDDLLMAGDTTHHTDKRAPLQLPVRKALAVFSGKRNPNDNHFSRSKH